ncbi:hypothetical protein DL98DRAFT_542019 [Cadophora sp. DSE1049]|nr:hypothetical protein DL98DRAFT_542019 [Cadophora sp. DSE1049]
MCEHANIRHPICNHVDGVMYCCEHQSRTGCIPEICPDLLICFIEPPEGSGYCFYCRRRNNRRERRRRRREEHERERDEIETKKRENGENGETKEDSDGDDAGVEMAKSQSAKYDARWRMKIEVIV